MVIQKLPTHTDLCRSVAKINAFLRVDNRDSARQWATILVNQLIKLSLINPANIGK